MAIELRKELTIKVSDFAKAKAEHLDRMYVMCEAYNNKDYLVAFLAYQRVCAEWQVFVDLGLSTQAGLEKIIKCVFIAEQINFDDFMNMIAYYVYTFQDKSVYTNNN